MGQNKIDDFKSFDYFIVLCSLFKEDFSISNVL